ncbi:MAG: VOC family protein [Firmicutes bacterium]|nr:VOC family protein [Bacillota bacterium]
MRPEFLDHVVLEVRDVERSLTFYVDLLGLKPERLEEFREGKAPFVSLRAGPSLIDLFPSRDPKPGPPHFCLAFHDSIAEVAAQLERAGFRPEEPTIRFGARGMGQSLYIRDPDGHQVELRSYYPEKPS